MIRATLTAAMLTLGFSLTLTAHRVEQKLACHAAQRTQLAYVSTAPLACAIK